MSAHKHTPGEWFMFRQGYSTVYVECRIGGGMVQEIAACGPTEAGPEQQEANARLIAAAPELLEALITKVKDAEQRSFEDWLEFNSPSGDHEAVQRQWLASNDYRGFIGEWREQLDAIAKATGEPA